MGGGTFSIQLDVAALCKFPSKVVGWIAKNLHALAEIPVTKKQLHKVCELLGGLPNSGAVPENLSDKLHETKKLLVGAFLMTMSIPDPFYRISHAVFL